MKHILIVFGLMLIFNTHAKDLLVGWELGHPNQLLNSQSAPIHLPFIKDGKRNINTGLSKHTNGLRYGILSQAIRAEVVTLVVRKDRAISTSLQSLADLTQSHYVIGVESSYFTSEQYQALMKTLEFQENIIEVADIEENVTLLLKGHIDGFLVEPAKIKAFAKQYLISNKFEQRVLDVFQSDRSLRLSKKAVKPIGSKVLNQAINDLKKAGELDDIINKWRKSN